MMDKDRSEPAKTAVAGQLERGVSLLAHPVRWWKERSRRTVPDEYLRDSYRRLAETQAQAQEHAGKCYSCRHAVAHVTWWCERDKAGLGCEWMACYSKDTITRADLAAGAGPVGGWLGLPATQVLIEQANVHVSRHARQESDDD